MERPGEHVIPFRRKCIYSVVALGVSFLLLELALAALGVRPVSGGSDPFVGFSGAVPLFLAEEGNDGTRWRRTAPAKLPWFNDQRFPERKAENTFRIFCLGGSTTQGQPYDDAVSFSGWLRELLPQADPSRNWEVINAGGISYASYRVAVLMEELAEHEPDLFIIYTGHNEFLEERTYGEVLRRPALLRALALAAARTRTSTVMESVLRPAKPKERTLLPAEVDAALDRSIGPETYQRDDLLRERVLEHFEFNADRMTSIARRAGADLLFVIPASSLKDCSPFKSEHRDGLSMAERRRFAWLFDRGGMMLDQGRAEDALGLFQQAGRIDSRYAALHDQMGRTLFSLGRYDEARAAFQRAIDEDVCPLRAISEIPEIIGRVAHRQRVPLVDFRALLDEACRAEHRHPVPGGEFFLDHVHPTIEGHRMLAVALTGRMAERGFVQLPENWRDEVLPEVTERVEGRLDRRDHAVALRNLAKVLAWAGRHDEAGRVVLEALESIPDDPESHYLAGCHFKHTGELERAIHHFRIALPHRPGDAEAQRLLADSLAEAGRWSEALVHFEQASRMLPEDPRLQARFAAVLAEVGRKEEAISHFRRILRKRPKDPDLHYNLGILLAGEGDLPAAAEHLAEAARLRPDDAAAGRALERLREAGQ